MHYKFTVCFYTLIIAFCLSTAIIVSSTLTSSGAIASAAFHANTDVHVRSDDSSTSPIYRCKVCGGPHGDINGSGMCPSCHGKAQNVAFYRKNKIAQLNAPNELV